MDPKQTEFLDEMANVVETIESIIEKYDMKDSVMFAMFCGFAVSENEEEQTSNISANVDLTLSSQLEVEIVKEFIQQAYDNYDTGLNDLLDGTGISLN